MYEMGQNLRLGLYAIELRPRREKPKPWQKPSTDLEVSKGKGGKNTMEPDKRRKQDDKFNSSMETPVAREKSVMWQVESVIDIVIEPTSASVTQLEAFKSLHNSPVGQIGAKLTWSRLKKNYPGHSLSMRQISDLISECYTCVKARASLMHSIKPIVKNMKPPHHRSAIGIDAFEIRQN